MEYVDITIPLTYGSIEARWYGDRSVRPILAIHGWLDNLGTWHTLMPFLPKHLSYLCIDLPGHGLSPKHPQGIRVEFYEFVRLVMQIVNYFQWPKISLLGHSLGAGICYVFTALFPELVDMVVALDTTHPRYTRSPNQTDVLRDSLTKYMIEDTRFDNIHDAPLYTYEELIEILFQGSGKSVLRENCKYILERNVTKSNKYPEKYYFSRDRRLTFYDLFRGSEELLEELSNRIVNIPFLVLRALESVYLERSDKNVLVLLKLNNPEFEYHEIHGTHHVHLNNPNTVAEVINPFIRKHRPPVPKKTLSKL